MTRSATADPTPLPSIKPAITERIAVIEKDLAARMMRRMEPPSPAAELLIDLRIIERWMLGQAVIAKPQSDLQNAALLRGSGLAEATTKLQQQLEASKSALSRTQTDAMAMVHKISFELADLKTVVELDDLCRRLGTALLNAASSTVVDTKTIPLMRPTPRGSADTIPDATASQGPRTTAELGAEVTRAAISISLRQQLLALVKANTAAETGKQPEAAALHQMLSDGVDLARGLVSSSAFPAEQRERIETKLAEGLALFADPRTRAAGRERVNQLAQYRLIMNQLQRDKLSAELRRTFAAGLANAQVNPESGQQFLSTLDQYVSISHRFESLPKRDNPVANLRRVTEDAAKAVETSKQAFILVANDASATSEQLDAALAELGTAVDLHGILYEMQQTYDAMNSYKPRPFGTIESRTLKAALAATAQVKSPMRGEARRYLSDLAKLAQLSSTATVRSMSDIPPPIVKTYAGVSLAEFETKCHTMMAELVSQAAGGSDLDKIKVARLRAVGDLCDSLRYAVLAEKAIGASPPLSRWVDWTLTPAQLRALLQPYQKDLAAAFSGFVQDAPGAVEKFLQHRGEQLPLIALLNRDARFAEQCLTMPEGLTGDLARMLAPLDNQPFGTERYVSATLLAGAMLVDIDPDAADEFTDAVMQRLKHDLSAAVRDLPAAIKGK